MSGHNKWAQIKHKKAATDAAKSREFARFARLIALESKKASGDANAPGVVAAVSRAKAVNMPKDNIERAIAKGASKDAGELDIVMYEAYGPGGAALIIEALTDNKNRTTQEMKHLLSKNGVELAAPGAASWAFTKSGDGRFVPNEPLVDLAEEDADRLSALLEAVDEHEDVQRAFTNARDFESTEE